MSTLPRPPSHVHPTCTLPHPPTHLHPTPPRCLEAYYSYSAIIVAITAFSIITNVLSAHRYRRRLAALAHYTCEVQVVAGGRLVTVSSTGERARGGGSLALCAPLHFHPHPLCSSLFGHALAPRPPAPLHTRSHPPPTHTPLPPHTQIWCLATWW